MKIVQEQILFDCLEQFEAGSSIEALQAKYPHAAEEIARFLTVAAHLQQVRVQPTVAAKKQSQKLFLQQAAQMRAAQRQAWFTWPSLRRTLLPLASLAMVTLLLGASFLFASASAVPGSLLYDTKRWVETLQLEQAGDATAVFNLQAQQNEERIREVKSLLRTDETAVVTFEGRINTKQDGNWIIAGISVHVSERTEVERGAETGALVSVDGRIQNGHLYANRIAVLAEAPATSTPSATVTAEPTATFTATATGTAMPTTTQTTTPTVTKTQTATPTVSMTATSTPAPTQELVTPTAVPPTVTVAPTVQPTAVANDDNDNDNDAADNGNDNSNNDNEANDNGSNDNADNDNDNGGHNDNDNDNGGGGNDNNSNDNDNDNDDDDNDNGGGNSGSGGGGNNGNDNNNDNDRADDD
ncbi:MAG: hypothetical protein H6653_11440 [Ardenticatenaceae bacterium]|nr:hypothetical protein [Ardenticatenaceae bacterium]